MQAAVQVCQSILVSVLWAGLEAADFDVGELVLE